MVVSIYLYCIENGLNIIVFYFHFEEFVEQDLYSWQVFIPVYKIVPNPISLCGSSISIASISYLSWV